MSDRAIDIQRYIQEAKERPVSASGTRSDVYIFDDYVLKKSAMYKREGDSFDRTTSLPTFCKIRAGLEALENKNLSIPKIVKHKWEDGFLFWLETRMAGDPMFYQGLHNLARKNGIEIPETDPFLFHPSKSVINKLKNKYCKETEISQEKLLDIKDEAFANFINTLYNVSLSRYIETDIFGENVLVSDNSISLIDPSPKNIDPDDTEDAPYEPIYVITELLRCMEETATDIYGLEKTDRLKNRNGQILEKFVKSYSDVVEEGSAIKYKMYLNLRENFAFIMGNEKLFDKFMKKQLCSPKR